MIYVLVIHIILMYYSVPHMNHQQVLSKNIHKKVCNLFKVHLN